MKDRKLREFLDLEEIFGDIYEGPNAIIRRKEFTKAMNDLIANYNLNFKQVSGQVSGLQRLLDQHKTSVNARFANVAVDLVRRFERLEKYLSIALVNKETPVYEKIKKSKKAKK